MLSPAPRLRPVLVPAALLVAAAVLLLTNDVPGPDLARSVVRAVADRPGWVHRGVEVLSEGGPVALALLLAAAAWRRRARVEPVVTALLAGAAVVGALGASEALKAAVAQDRPCRVVPGLTALVECPPPGDWSLPSNHATLAAALATAVVLLAPAWWRVAVPLALLVGASRVALGVHLPHDVVDGLVLGSAVVLAVVVPLRRPAARLVRALAGFPHGHRLRAMVTRREP
ncbi:undecaprenyl-diphosphatase [Geodermatophilus saharensis]|uniref:Undecaprenyl-diphosphatase n=1 Tax=Geodermatophilus saharensis TaxID=1137994 RepID=A0A239E7L5_9ACTN|nr:phosphatase PAP2 family protein [Geodermatophilus saharensis]SNS39993.1 undecaprenyl-diphosphatase [Geodermatophilus saharensis]